MGIQINGQTDTISSTDGSLNIGGTVTVNVTGDATGLTGTPDITVGAVTASSATISGDLTVNGTTTTLDTTLTEVDKLEVGANNTTVGVAITQSGTGDILRLYDGATQVVTVADGGSVGIGTDNPNGGLEVYNSNQAVSIVRGNKATLAILGDDSNSGASDTDARIILCGDGTIANSVSALTTSPLSNHGFEIALINEEPGSGLRFHDGTANAERLRIDSSGRLLIGTTTEGEANADDLTIASSGNTGITIRSGTANRGNIYFSDGTSGDAEYRGYLEYNHDGDRFSIGTANATRLFIDSSGIIKANNSLRLANSGGGEAKLLYTGTSNDVYPELAGIYSDANYGVNTATDILIKTTAAGQTTPTERLRIDSSGNVGIGSDNPSGKLDIQGNFEGSSNFALRFVNTKGTGRTYGFRSHGTNGEAFTLYHGSIRMQSWNDYQSGGNTVFYSGGTESFRIHNNGNIGIGTDNPEVKLELYDGGMYLKNQSNTQGVIFRQPRPELANVQQSNGRGMMDALVSVPASTTVSIARSHWGGIALVGFSGGAQGYRLVSFGYNNTPTVLYSADWQGSLVTTFSTSTYDLRVSHNSGTAKTFWVILIGV